MSEKEPVRRRRRADADRSREMILAAAITLLDEQVGAGMERIAEAARVTRQTVYAHFPSRDALLNAVVDELTIETLEAIDALDLDHGPALGKVLEVIHVSWRAFDQHPLLLQLPHTSAQDERHNPVVERLGRLIRRGQRAGEITRDLPSPWLVSSVIALGHAAGETVATNRLTRKQASAALRTTITRLLQEPSRQDKLRS